VQVACAHDGADGLTAVRELEPVAVVLDIKLPGLDGWEVLRQIRAEQATRELPVIIVSILDEKSRGLAFGADDYLVKPVARDDLVSALREVGALPTPRVSP
jgi:DNA-binding response OmpR family regulator